MITGVHLDPEDEVESWVCDSHPWDPYMLYVCIYTLYYVYIHAIFVCV